MSELPSDISSTLSGSCANEPVTSSQIDVWFREQVILGIVDADAGNLLTAEEVDALAEARIAQAMSRMERD